MDLFTTLFYQPIYNALVLLVSAIPGGDVGLAVVILTLLVRFVLAPLSIQAMKSQKELQVIQPLMKELQEKYKNDKETQAKKMMELYKEHKVNPFASIGLILLQIPVIIALYMVFQRESLPNIDPELLYSFVAVPGAVSLMFLGFLNIHAKSIVLAVVAGLLQFLQGHLSLKNQPQTVSENTFMQEFQKSMRMQIRFVIPLLIGFVAYSISSAIAIYLITSTIFSIGQELILRKPKGPEATISAVNKA